MAWGMKRNKHGELCYPSQKNPPRKLYPRTQAERIIAKFGGAERLHSLLNEVGHEYSLIAVRSWLDQTRLAKGLIPTPAWNAIILAAKYDGIVLGLEDFDPRPRLLTRALDDELPTNRVDPDYKQILKAKKYPRINVKRLERNKK